MSGHVTNTRLVWSGIITFVLIVATIVLRLQLGHQVAVLWVGALAGISAFLTLALGFFDMRKRQTVKVGGSIERSAVHMKGASSQDVSAERDIVDADIDLEMDDSPQAKKV